MARSRPWTARDLKPMLATLADGPFDDPDWVFEVKWDGYRLLAEIKNGTATLISRNGIDVSKKYPEICSAFADARHDAVVDGELVALGKDGKPNFQLMQNVRRSRAALVFYAFDLLFLGTKDLRDMPLLERKTMLKKMLPKKAEVRFSDHIRKDGVQYFKAAEKQELEGIMAKRADSPYLSGKRSDLWLKIKTAHRQEAVVIGYTKPRNSRKYIGSLVLAVREKNGWRYVGHTGGSMGGKSLQEVHDMLSPLETKKRTANVPRDVERSTIWVQPKIIVEVKFSEWTEGGHMRHPIVAGFRDDKKPTDVGFEKATPAKRSHGVNAFSHVEKMYWPEEGYTKGDVIDYYDRMADVILPYLKDRPMVLNRHPNGITKPGFFQKDTSDLHLPDFVETTVVRSESNGKNIRYILCNNKETLLYIANLGCIELNPWNSRVGSIDRPYFYVIDLDPGDNTFDEVVEVARVTHEVLEMACESSFPKTSGKTGIHIYVPLHAKYTYDRVREFAGLLVQLIHRRLPELTSLERSPKKRRHTIYLDWLQNRIGQTLAAPYSLRPAPGATVSTPLRWREVKKGLSPRRFNIETIFGRIKKKGDLWSPLLGRGVDLHESIRCLEAELGTPAKKRR